MAKKANNSRHDDWCRQANWLVDIMVKLDSTPSAHGLKWQSGMIRHYAEKYINLTSNTPKQCVKTRKKLDDKILPIIERHIAYLESL